METGPHAPIKTQKTFVCNKAIVTNLIKQDLINWKMIHSLQKVQVRADDYKLDISSVIFGIMDLENREDVDELFVNFLSKIKYK